MGVESSAGTVANRLPGGVWENSLLGQPQRGTVGRTSFCTCHLGGRTVVWVGVPDGPGEAGTGTNGGGVDNRNL